MARSVSVVWPFGICNIKLFTFYTSKGAGRVKAAADIEAGPAARSVRRDEETQKPQWRAQSITNAATRRKEEVSSEQWALKILLTALY
jgi:hypothetical protein